ncbi:MAG: uncharacterized protein JWL85_983 [Candidatus Saccharibacteria bacterium]|nr:uncharacterized protein [Candidatus Saccharibacteria bacterium]
MLDTVMRFIKRAAIFIPGALVSYFTVANVYPTLDKRIPAWIATLLTYVLIAYVLIPAAMRLYRLFFPPKHMPLYSLTPDGFANDPVNIAFVGTREEVDKAMEAAGWYPADKRTPRNLLRMGLGILLKQPYPTAPFSNLYLFGHSQDLGYQLPVDDNPGHRHHVRFWLAGTTGDPRQLDHLSFWQKYHKFDAKKERGLWVGAASLDTGIALIRHNAQFTHMIHPNTSAERQLIVKMVKKTGLVKRVRMVKIGDPYKLTNRALHGYMVSDGKMAILELQDL